MKSKPFVTNKRKCERNRKKRKATWINMTNRMRKYADCNYDGLFYCNHVYREDQGWTWVDFSFYHTKLKRYFAVAMTTLEHSEWDKNCLIVDNQLDEIHPYPNNGMLFGPIDPKTSFGELTISDTWDEVYEARKPLADEMLQKLNNVVSRASPTIEVKDYGNVSVGLWATVNEPRINPQVIKNFIELFRSIGEPITPGFIWKGDEVDVLPANIDKWTPDT